MSVLNRLQLAGQYIDPILNIIALVSFLFHAAGITLQEAKVSAPFLIENALNFFIAGTFALVVLLIVWVSHLNRRFTRGFKDDFKKPITNNWDFQGDWSIQNDNSLRITDSHFGGITKVGAIWENYTLSFEANIINKCIGVILRAKNLSNYYMFQIANIKIRPHRLVTFPVVPRAESEKIEQRKDVEIITPVPFVT